MALVSLSDITVPPERIRKEFPLDQQEALIQSILTKGLFHPLVVDKPDVDGKMALLAGERRFRALSEIAKRGLDHHCNGKILKPGFLFVTFIRELNPADRIEAELEENSIRLDIPWQEKSRAVEMVHKLRQQQKVLHTLPGLPVPEQTPKETAAELKDKPLEEVTRREEADVRADLLVAAWGEDPEVSAAKTRKDALKIIETKLEMEHRKALAREFNKLHASTRHDLRQGSCIELMEDIPDGLFDCICTDPPYGVGAHAWQNGNANEKHSYTDDAATFDKIVQALARESYRITKPKAHLYLFHDFSRFQELRILFQRHGWDVWPRPLIWYRGNNRNIAPRPEHGPMNSYECILFANKGDKRVLYLKPDVLLVPNPQHLRRAAEKPAALFAELLSRSCVPGDEVFDPCCGTGPIFPAANKLNLKATGFDLDQEAVGIASSRLEETIADT